MLKIKRVYDAPAPEDGYRVLVDRLWPRGLTKERAGLDEWLKEIGPSNALRTWFGHDPSKWEEFFRRFREELKDKPDLLAHLRRQAAAGPVTLLFGAKDEEHNNAVVLKEMLEAA